ncbi:hypothetical protein SS05631_c13960 [Sinorhizobium sp. CCBAU 05631]|nr:hypothetical protein SS05631_c13960 [Sinorhizobium sp. CCBAU 05631]
MRPNGTSAVLANHRRDHEIEAGRARKKISDAKKYLIH